MPQSSLSSQIGEANGTRTGEASNDVESNHTSETTFQDCSSNNVAWIGDLLDSDTEEGREVRHNNEDTSLKATSNQTSGQSGDVSTGKMSSTRPESTSASASSGRPVSHSPSWRPYSVYLHTKGPDSAHSDGSLGPLSTHKQSVHRQSEIASPAAWSRIAETSTNDHGFNCDAYSNTLGSSTAGNSTFHLPEITSYHHFKARSVATESSTDSQVQEPNSGVYILRTALTVVFILFVTIIAAFICLLRAHKDLEVSW